jgi:ligand-binding sensor domain-containing protein
MKIAIKITFHLFALIFIISCNNQNKTDSSKDSSDDNQNKSTPNPFAQRGINLPGDDPYFIETADTISSHGPRNITRNILQDKNGNMWFATWEGIIRYDGKVFTNVTLKENLKHFRVFSLLEDRKGNIWFGTMGGGVYCYDSKTFTNFTSQDGLIDNNVTCILEDKTGNIWFATNGGPCSYNGKSFISFVIKEDLSSKDIFSMAEDKTGNIWFATRNDGVFFYDGKSFTAFTNKEGLPFREARSIMEDKKGNIWIGSKDGLCCYDPSNASFTNFKMNSVTNIFEDKTGNLWLSAGEVSFNTMDLNGATPKNAYSGMALYRYDPSAALRTGSSSFSKITEKNEPNDHQIFGVMEDQAGNIWFGTMNGVYCYDPKGTSGKTFDNFSE